MINLTCSSSESLRWKKVKAMRVGSLRLVDQDTSVLDHKDLGNQLPLKFVKEPAVVEDSNGIKELTVTGQWDSSLHGSSLLDRPTNERHSVQMSISVDIASERIPTVMTFTLDQTLQIRPRSWSRPQSMFKALWKTSRIIHYTSGIFSVSLKPASTKRASDIWRMDSQQTYVKGEEGLSNWKPRGVTLVRDYAVSQQRRQRVTEVEATKVFLRRHKLSPPPQPSSSDELNGHQQALVEKCLALWTKPSGPLSSPRLPATIPISQIPPAALSPGPSLHTPQTKSSPPTLTARIHSHPKNPVCLKSSYLLTPTGGGLAWTRHFAELRPPYLHLYAVPSGSETATINLRNARIDIDPPVQQLLQQGPASRKNVWAVYARGGSWLFAARSEEEKGRWVLAVDEGFIEEEQG